MKSLTAGELLSTVPFHDMSRKVKIHETHAFEVYDALGRMRGALEIMDIEDSSGLSVRSWSAASRLRTERLDLWDRSALGRLYWMLKKKLH